MGEGLAVGEVAGGNVWWLCGAEAACDAASQSRKGTISYKCSKGAGPWRNLWRSSALLSQVRFKQNTYFALEVSTVYLQKNTANINRPVLKDAPDLPKIIVHSPAPVRCVSITSEIITFLLIKLGLRSPGEEAVPKQIWRIWGLRPERQLCKKDVLSRAIGVMSASVSWEIINEETFEKLNVWVQGYALTVAPGLMDSRPARYPFASAWRYRSL